MFGPIEQRHQQNQQERDNGSFWGQVGKVAGIATNAYNSSQGRMSQPQGMMQPSPESFGGGSFGNGRFGSSGGGFGYGSGGGFGQGSRAAYQEVQASNMSKACKTEDEALQTVVKRTIEQNEACHYEKVGDYYIVYRTRDRKVMKNINYFRPDLKQFFTDKEIQKSYLSGESIQTLYFGGGTPSILSVKQIIDIIETVKKCPSGALTYYKNN